MIADEERVFLISEELEFRSGVTDDEPTFIWRDLDGDVDELYEFVASGTNEPTRAFFETCMYRAMYERKFKASADSTKDSDLDQFIWRLALLVMSPLIAPLITFSALSQKLGARAVTGSRRRINKTAGTFHQTLWMTLRSNHA
jgi:hypothetical protein